VRQFIAHCLVVALSLLAPTAWAGVGASSSGVTTTDPTNPTQEVQDQSSAFVAQNQQIQSAAERGITLPGTVNATGNHAGGASGQHDGSGAGNAADGKHGSEKPEPPPPPPPPPPTYVSHMRPVNRAEPPPVADTEGLVAQVEKPVNPIAMPKNATPAPVAKPPPVERKNTPTQSRPEPSPPPSDEAPLVVAAGPTGGRGAAPGGFTFYVGLLIAGALLALALRWYLLLGRGDAPK
jgi:hypothetical protein